ncbi:MAG: radical SAM/SPASM domain-containing protein [Clostridiaceae bacterium]
MSVEEYEFVLSSLQSKQWGNVFQVALGGGEPLEHPKFTEIINTTYEKGIVANFTTNGLHLNENIVKSIKNKVGAVAISVNNIEELNLEKVKLLTDSGIKTNIHFVLDNKSIIQAIEILKGKYNDFFNKVNGVIFLTYKPAGRATIKNTLSINEKLKKFTSLIGNNKCISRIGFDACFVPILMKFTNVEIDYIDSCECGFFSIYIDENLNVKPCSFANNDTYTFNLKNYNMKEIWHEKYSKLRDEVNKNICESDCKNKTNCRGKCNYFDSLSFCFSS